MVGLVGCSKSPEQEAKSEKAMLEVKVQDVVKSLLKDPNSAEFQNMDGVCGEVNSKNSFGGYTGFKKFVVSKEDSQVYFDPGDTNMPNQDYARFNSAWFKYCEK